MVQQTVSNDFNATGFPGEFSRSVNQDSDGKIINSASEALNLPGVVVLTVQGNDYEVGVAADGAFAGILAEPKTSNRPTLDAASFIQNETQVTVATQGYVFSNLGAAANIGDWVYYSDTDGTLATAAPGASAPAGHTRLPGGLVTGLNVAGAGIAEIYLDKSGSTEQPA